MKHFTKQMFLGEIGPFKTSCMTPIFTPRRRASCGCLFKYDRRHNNISIIIWLSWKDVGLENPVLWVLPWKRLPRWLGNAHIYAHCGIQLIKASAESAKQHDAAAGHAAEEEKHSRWLHWCVIHPTQLHGNCGFGGIKYRVAIWMHASIKL